MSDRGRSSEAERLLTADDVAARWQVPRSHVYRLAREDRLPTVRLGRYMRWRPEAIDAFEREGGAAANG
jgi:excisionase family DNA binding protein